MCQWQLFLPDTKEQGGRHTLADIGGAVTPRLV
jgi:hypothetical protein